jgi:hypothetical protein
MGLDQHDACPYCQARPDIICVKFRMSGVRMVSACPICGMASVDDCGPAKDPRRQSARDLTKALFSTLRMVLNMMETLNSRFRYVVVFVVAAVVVAAVLRHTIHVYGGISPGDICTHALIALWPAIALFLIFRARSRQG